MKLKRRTIHISLIAIILLWVVVTNAWGYSNLIFGELQNNWDTYLYGLVSRAIWVVPAIILIKRYRIRYQSSGKNYLLISLTGNQVSLYFCLLQSI